MNIKLSLKERVYPETLFGGYSDLDLTVLFYGRVTSLLNKDSVVLDLGCGRGYTQFGAPTYNKTIRDLRDKCSNVIGADVDTVAATNPLINTFILIKDGKIDLEPSSIDIVICDFVLEHVSDVETFFDEVERVLKPGGIFCARTTNRLGYVAIFSRLIPDRFHNFLLRKFQKSRDAEDIFPAFYRANSTKVLKKRIAKFSEVFFVKAYEAEPSYFKISFATYFIFKYVHCLIPPKFRNTILLFAKKRGDKLQTF